MPEVRELATIILAAGQGKRMKSDLPKVLHPIGGEPMLLHVIRQAKSSGAKRIVVIVGHKRELVIPVVEQAGVDHAYQDQLLGTGHAAMMSEPALKDHDGEILVLSGDVPLLSEETIRRVVEYHRQKKVIATVITAEAPDPTGYGRVLRDDDGKVVAIREHKDCSDEEREIKEINSGIYLYDAKHLFPALHALSNDNSQGEYYLTDVFEAFFKKNMPVAAWKADFAEIHGVNTVHDLEEAEQIWRERQE
ncbi:MAG TPA: UDP-N-acetylglucosamine pyrophosphorylase [Bacteroidetes bacterium]|nr:bifunctional protein GlmU [bacterium BMS3Bbin04]HDO64922.1 UDP-N-acetylglucosamine pyrophosphorylase [Bacteroidota bacterium]HEX04047.1 UDP-N-acetylglucosamine pyrophosphorylase [Bacteroidota bacterium]